MQRNSSTHIWLSFWVIVGLLAGSLAPAGAVQARPRQATRAAARARLAAQANAALRPGAMYRFDIAGAPVPGEISELGKNVSLNDRGKVAFVGRLKQDQNTVVGEGLYLGDGLSPARNINPGWSRNSRVIWGEDARINNADQVVAVDRDHVMGPTTYLRIWNGTPGQEDQFTQIARANPNDANAPFWAFYTGAAINNAGQIATAALRQNDDFLVTPRPANSPPQQFDEFRLNARPWPALDDNGFMVAANANRVLRFNYALNNIEPLTSGFARMSRRLLSSASCRLDTPVCGRSSYR